MAKEKKKGHPRFRTAVAQIVYEIRQDLKADDLESLAALAETFAKVVKEEKAFRSKDTPVIDRLAVGYGKKAR